jgi:hypothetical protein
MNSSSSSNQWLKEFHAALTTAGLLLRTAESEKQGEIPWCANGGMSRYRKWNKGDETPVQPVFQKLGQLS